MEMLGKIRRMHVRHKMSVRAIAKRKGLPATPYKNGARRQTPNAKRTRK